MVSPVGPFLTNSTDGKWVDREAEIQTWVKHIFCPVHHQYSKVLTFPINQES